jgi:hypothetical protein
MKESIDPGKKDVIFPKKGKSLIMACAFHFYDKLSEV